MVPIGINIGADKDGLVEARKNIVEIMKVESSTMTEAIKVEALRTLVALCKKEPVSISNCIFNAGGKKNS